MRTFGTSSNVSPLEEHERPAALIFFFSTHECQSWKSRSEETDLKCQNEMMWKQKASAAFCPATKARRQPSLNDDSVSVTDSNSPSG